MFLWRECLVVKTSNRITSSPSGVGVWALPPRDRGHGDAGARAVLSLCRLGIWVLPWGGNWSGMEALALGWCAAAASIQAGLGCCALLSGLLLSGVGGSGPGSMALVSTGLVWVLAYGSRRQVEGHAGLWLVSLDRQSEI
ncbi:hypothetical protein ATANTOWER_019861 [Ataeniobius toweri]|uniref:Uncharacterized protein n=1 Tax=Ataeniobius toweri TaxID=208326 RepID=A0ABU7CHL5_9TELE|nr:hypothetical protein [Ataeniobius toweri]